MRLPATAQKPEACAISHAAESDATDWYGRLRCDAQHPRDAPAARVGDRDCLTADEDDRLHVAVPSPIREVLAPRDECRAHRRLESRVGLFHEGVGGQQLVVNTGCRDG